MIANYGPEGLGKQREVKRKWLRLNLLMDESERGLSLDLATCRRQIVRPCVRASMAAESFIPELPSCLLQNRGHVLLLSCLWKLRERFIALLSLGYSIATAIMTHCSN